MLTLVTEVVTVASAAGSAMPPALGKDQARRHWQTIYGTFPDMRMDAVDLTMDGDTAFAEISHGGTMQGPMGDKAPTGKAYNVTGAFRIDFIEGKIRSIKSYWDTAAMARQLGLMS
jgi:predicted ester cyclase